MSKTNQKILFVGPGSFNPNSWKTRADYILPDLFTSVAAASRIYMLTPPAPDFASESLSALCRRFSVSHMEAQLSKMPAGNLAERWKRATKEAAQAIQPDVITNSLGSLMLGTAIVHAAEKMKARSVIRVAGDEIGSRLAMGKYTRNEKRYENDRDLERSGFIGADTIIAMSPWERDRIWRILGNCLDKVKICIRGIDLERFGPDRTNHPRSKIRRFLYVGRKSAEKGYDVIEAAAQKVYLEDPSIEFLFVGDFEPCHRENRRYLGWVEAAGLPQLYHGADAFILSSRSEGFPQVVAEAMAAGLPCILSEKLFSNLFKHDKDALLTSLSREDLVEQILRLSRDPELAERLSLRSRRIAEDFLDKDMWCQRYASILRNRPTRQKTIFDLIDSEKATAFTADTPQLRVAFISPRVFGIMGTQGSYGLARAFSRATPTMVISRRSVHPGVLPIVAEDAGLDNHHLVDFSSPMAGDNIASLIKDFKPDILHFVNDHAWVDLIPMLKSRFPMLRFVVDFKTPLMADGAKRKALQTSGQKKAANLDLVVALSSEIARTWIPDYTGPLSTYPLGIILSQFTPRVAAIPCNPDKVRFIYIGQTHPKRRLPKLLQLIAALEASVKERLTLDIYGAGGGEQEIDDQIDALKLNHTVFRKAPLTQNLLFALLPEYDCGIAWVPKEIYDAAPSLKFLEYAAAGIGIIASDTLGHRRNIMDGFKAPLFTEDSESFKDSILKVISGEISEQIIKENKETVKRFDFDWIVQKKLLPEYKKLVFSAGICSQPRERIRLLYLTTRPLGAMATPGTYLSIDAFAEHCDIHVIAKPYNNNDPVKVHHFLKPIPITLIEPQAPDYLKRIKSIVLTFKPDMVCIGSWPGWHTAAAQIRKAFPEISIILEVKSPVISTRQAWLARQKHDWQDHHKFLEAIIAPSRGMASSYIERIERPFLRHRSVIDYSAIAKKTFDSQQLICKKFVFSGSLARLRRIDKLIDLFSLLPGKIIDGINLDIFGDGPAREELTERVKALNLHQKIRFLGAIPQQELFQRYKDYDAGIAWVPKSHFNSAPSLKLIEYCACGISPLATRTGGHLLQRDYGFFVDFFEEDNAQSFLDAMSRFCTEGVKVQQLQANISKAEKFDYRAVISNEILPFYQKILRVKSEEKKLPKTTGHVRAEAHAAMRASHLNIWAQKSLKNIEIDRSPFRQEETGIAFERKLHAKRMQSKIMQHFNGKT